MAFFSKIGLFLIGVFQRNSILDRKKRFKDQKFDVLTRAKKWTFFKGVSPWRFVEKSNFFLSAFVTEILSENIVFDIVERKE